jgi:hypothetical protein
MKRSDVVKMIWEHVKANDLQVPTDKRVRATCPRNSKLLFVFARTWGAHALVPRCFVVVIAVVVVGVVVGVGVVVVVAVAAAAAAANVSTAATTTNAAANAAVVLVLVVAVDLRFRDLNAPIEW